jgi:DNA-directed RNA polymerase specialized sigma24 family protein
MARLAEGDRSAFDPLYDALWPMMTAVCARRLSDPSLAEDAAQQALIAVFRKHAAWDPSRPALPWILGFAVREASAVARRHHRAATHAPEPAADPTPEDAVVQADLLAALRAAVLDLDPADTDALQRALQEDRAPLPTDLRKRIERARARLLRLWRTRHGST